MAYRLCVFVAVLAAGSCGVTRLEEAPGFDAGLSVRDGGAVRFDAGNPVMTADAGGGFMWADAGTFVPFDAGSGLPIVRFAALGDQGKGNDAQRKVGAALGTVCAQKGCDFVVLLGDNFYESGVDSVTDPQWKTGFVEPYATVDAGFYVTLGNHDYGASGRGTDIGHEQAELDYARINSKWILPAHHYKWSLGPADFFSADTNRSMLRRCNRYNPLCAGHSIDDDDVRRDFTKWLATSTNTWKVAIGHHTYRSNGKHGNAGNYDGLSYLPIVNGEGVREFVDEIVCGKADVYLCGHDHTREWIQSTCTSAGSSINTEIIVSGGGASVTPFEGPGENPFYWRASSSGFLYVVIEGRTFTGTFYNDQGVAEFTRSFTK